MKLISQSKVNTKPRISLNKLGEYLLSKPGRRRTILKRQKYPKAKIISRTNNFYSCLHKCIENGGISDDVILDEILRLDSSANGQDWHDQNLEINSRLLKNLLRIKGSFEVNGLQLEAAPNARDHLSVEGVSVSIRPELYFRGRMRGKDVFGGVKFHLPKTHALNTDSGEYVATMLKTHLEGICPKHAIVRNDLCLVVDLPTEEVFSAPKSFKQRWNDIEAACFEIKNQWKAI